MQGEMVRDSEETKVSRRQAGTTLHPEPTSSSCGKAGDPSAMTSTSWRTRTCREMIRRRSRRRTRPELLSPGSSDRTRLFC